MITFYFNSNLPEYYTGDLCEVFDNLMLKFILLLNDKKTAHKWIYCDK